MEKNIAVIKGDGIGPEIVTEAMKVLDKVAAKFGHKFNYEQLLMGGCSIDANGVPLTDETIERQSAYIDKDIRHQWQDTRQKHKSVLIKLKSDFEANADKWSDEIAKRTIG